MTPTPSAPPRLLSRAANSPASEGVGGFPRIAALFVQKNGSYWGLDDVDPWDEARDARKYAGPWPVVAHPPCQRWGKFWAGQPAWIARTGERKVKGDDGGCFEHGLWVARTFGGVMEHPEGSHAWTHFGLNKPPRSGGWVKADDFGGWTCCVEQGQYGHYARKPTWLLVYGVAVEDLPDLRWGKSEPVFPQWAIDRYGIAKCKRAGELAFKGGGKDNKHRIGTPPEFRDLLISIARSVPHPSRVATDPSPVGHRQPSRGETSGGSEIATGALGVAADGSGRSACLAHGSVSSAHGCEGGAV